MVGDRHDLAQLVGDQDDGLCPAPSGCAGCGTAGRPPAASARRSARPGSGSSAPRNSAFRISTRCCTPTGRSCDRGVERRPRGRSRARAPRSRARARSIPAAQREAALGAEQQVLQHGERLDQHEMLVDHADAARDRVLRACGSCARWPSDQDLAAVGLVEAVEDVHQRRLAGAVLADDAVDGAGGDDEAMSRLAWTAPKRLLMPRSSIAGGERGRGRRSGRRCRHRRRRDATASASSSSP